MGGGELLHQPRVEKTNADATMPSVAASSTAPASIVSQPSSSAVQTEQLDRLYQSYITTQHVAELEQRAHQLNNWLHPVTVFEGVDLHTSFRYVLSPNCMGAFAEAKKSREPWITDQETHKNRQFPVFRIINDIQALLNRVFKVGDGVACSLRNADGWRPSSSAEEMMKPRNERTLHGVTFECTHACAPDPAKGAADDAADRSECIRRPNTRNHRNGCGFFIKVRFCAKESDASKTIFEITERCMQHSGHPSPLGGTVQHNVTKTLSPEDAALAGTMGQAGATRAGIAGFLGAKTGTIVTPAAIAKARKAHVDSVNSDTRQQALDKIIELAPAGNGRATREAAEDLLLAGVDPASDDGKLLIKLRELAVLNMLHYIAQFGVLNASKLHASAQLSKCVEAGRRAGRPTLPLSEARLVVMRDSFRGIFDSAHGASDTSHAWLGRVVEGLGRVVDQTSSAAESSSMDDDDARDGDDYNDDRTSQLLSQLSAQRSPAERAFETKFALFKFDTTEAAHDPKVV
jgi:hypothetical protein